MPPTAVPQDHKRKKDSRPVEEPESRPFMADDKYAPTAWGSSRGYEEIVTPSGQLCLVRRPGVQNLIEAGVLHDVDTLSAIVSEEHLKRVGDETQIDVDSFAKDAASVANVLHVVDRVVTYCVVKPEVVMTPNDVTRRQAGVIYADMIDIDDRMFIFNYAVGGTRSVEQFRKDTEALVGGVASVEDDAGSAE